MSQETINVGGEEKTVREDTAKSYRGTIWILGTLGIVVVIALVIFFAFFARSGADGSNITSPANIERQSGR